MSTLNRYSPSDNCAPTCRVPCRSPQWWRCWGPSGTPTPEVPRCPCPPPTWRSFRPLATDGRNHQLLSFVCEKPAWTVVSPPSVRGHCVFFNNTAWDLFGLFISPLVFNICFAGWVGPRIDPLKTAPRDLLVAAVGVSVAVRGRQPPRRPPPALPGPSPQVRPPPPRALWVPGAIGGFDL